MDVLGLHAKYSLQRPPKILKAVKGLNIITIAQAIETDRIFLIGVRHMLYYWIILETCSQGQNEKYISCFIYRWLLNFGIYFLKPKLNTPIDRNNATRGPVFLDENKDDRL